MKQQGLCYYISPLFLFFTLSFAALNWQVIQQINQGPTDISSPVVQCFPPKSVGGNYDCLIAAGSTSARIPGFGDAPVAFTNRVWKVHCSSSSLPRGEPLDGGPCPYTIILTSHIGISQDYRPQVNHLDWIEFWRHSWSRKRILLQILAIECKHCRLHRMPERFWNHKRSASCSGSQRQDCQIQHLLSDLLLDHPNRLLMGQCHWCKMRRDWSGHWRSEEARCRLLWRLQCHCARFHSRCHRCQWPHPDRSLHKRD